MSQPLEFFSAFQTVTVKSGQMLDVSLAGTWIEILDASLPQFGLKLPNRQVLQVSAGLSIPTDFISGFQIQNFNATDLTVTFHVGTASIGDRRAVKNAPTYAVGNMGAIALVAPYINANGWISISQANFPAAKLISQGIPAAVANAIGGGLYVPFINAGNRRLQIVFTVDPGASQGLDLFDLNGNAFLYVARGASPVTFQTDAGFILQCESWTSGGSSTLKIGELYYARTTQ